VHFEECHAEERDLDDIRLDVVHQMEDALDSLRAGEHDAATGRRVAAVVEVCTALHDHSSFRGAWSRVTIDRLRRLALQTF
jgi:hypothetical protein